MEDEIKKLELRAAILKQALRQLSKSAEILEIPKEEVEKQENYYLDELSKTLKQISDLKK